MSRHTYRIAVFVLIGTAVAFATLGHAAGEAPRHVTALAWMSGSWEMDDGPSHVEEHWTCPSPDSLIGMGRTVVNGKTAFFEYLRIEERPDGIFYMAQPKGRPATPFKLVTYDGTTAVFENPEHDFPKRVIYTRKGSDSLLARIEGDAASKEKAADFRYRRMAKGCR